MEAPQRMVGLPTIFRNQDERVEPVEAKITGQIPNWIRGSYFRVGPGKFDIGDVTMKSFMDGYAMVTKFQIEDGKVKFSKRYLESDAYKRAIAAKKPVYPEFSTRGNPGEGKSLLNRVIGAFGSSGITDNDTVSLYTIEGKLFAASETCHINNVNPTDLSTTENKIDYYKYFGIYMATAHPLRCSKTGDLYNIGTSFKPTLKYQVIRIPNMNGSAVKDALKKSEVVATIYPSWNTCVSYYHSFAMTENYIIHIEQPFLMNLLKMAEAKMMGKGFRDAMEWTPTEKNRFHIVDKRTGEVLKTKYFADTAFFYFHHVNAYEEDGGDMIVMDIDTYEDSKVIDKMNVKLLREEDVADDTPVQLKRFYLPVIRNVKEIAKNTNLVQNRDTTASAIKDSDNNIIISSEIFGQPGFEGPIVNPTVATKKHRYIYGTGACLPGFYANAVCKLDLDTGDVKLWKENKSTYPGEPLFLCPPKSKEEDDGILISAISDSQPENDDFLVFLNPKTMEEVARASLSAQIPQAVHGVFIPS